MGEWIKCSERMPEEFEDVRVTDGVYVGVTWLDCDGCWDSWLAPLDVTVDPGEITHWMPLPEPPEV